VKYVNEQIPKKKSKYLTKYRGKLVQQLAVLE